jgi:hypothetical protein
VIVPEVTRDCQGNVFPHLKYHQAAIVPSNDNVTEGVWPATIK